MDLKARDAIPEQYRDLLDYDEAGAQVHHGEFARAA